jgi:F0F1-type ATP synthase membrane subunit b/b'
MMLYSLGLVLAIQLSVGACGKSDKGEGPAEKAGASMGKAVDQATEQASRALDKAGETLKEAGEKAEETAKDAVDKIKQDKK